MYVPRRRFGKIHAEGGLVETPGIRSRHVHGSRRDEQHKTEETEGGMRTMEELSRDS